MQLTIPSLMFAFAIIAVATAGALYRFKGNVTTKVSARLWVRGYMLMALGSLVMLIENWIPYSVFSVVGNVIIFGGALHLPSALLILNHRQIPVKRYRNLTVSSLVVLAICQALDFKYQVLAISVFYMVMMIAGIEALLVRRKSRSREKTPLIERVMAAIFGLMVIVLIVNGVGGLFLDIKGQDAASRTWTQQLLLLCSIVSGTGLTVGFHWLIHRTLETELRSLNRKLQEQNERLAQFAHTISHDLKSPLFSVTGNIELALSSGTKLPDLVVDSLDKATKSAGRLNLMVDELLEWSRINSLNTDQEIADCLKCLNSAMTNLEARIVDCGASIKTVADSDSTEHPPIRCNERLLTQLFQNLLANALEYRHPERVPEILVSLEPEQDGCLFSISDCGRGIDPADQENIFNLFSRGTNTDSVIGTGVGLAICKSIVEKYGGSIWFDSTLDEGTTFFFTLKY